MWAALERDDAAALRPLAWDRRFLPHFFRGEPADFHLTLDGYLHDLHRRRGAREACLAPRGGAKSTVHTTAYVLRCAVSGWEPYILILSDGTEQADKFLADIRAEVETNELLRAVYPDACGPGGQWRQGAIVLANGVRIESLGRGKRIRGRKNRQHRPTLIVFDDLQSRQDIISPVERGHAWDWFTREALPAGDERTNMLSVVTALHREAIAVRVGTLPGWTLRTFRAVHDWPERADLWAEWERLATNLADPARLATADAFYDARPAEMGRGGRSYWPAKWPLKRLMLERAILGPSAFDTEYQQNPRAADGAEWPPDYLDGPDLWFDDWKQFKPVYRVQSLDPSKGADSRAGDYQAHVDVGLTPDGTILVEATLAREAVPLMVSRAIDLARAFMPLDSLVVEDNQGLGLLMPEFRRQLGDQVLPLEAVLQTQNKVVRVRRLGSYLAQRRVRFRATPGTRLLVDQLRDFPNADHDDGPDALELAVRRLELLTAGR